MSDTYKRPLTQEQITESRKGAKIWEQNQRREEAHGFADNRERNMASQMSIPLARARGEMARREFPRVLHQLVKHYMRSIQARNPEFQFNRENYQMVKDGVLQMIRHSVG